MIGREISFWISGPVIPFFFCTNVDDDSRNDEDPRTNFCLDLLRPSFKIAVAVLLNGNPLQWQCWGNSGNALDF